MSVTDINTRIGRFARNHADNLFDHVEWADDGAPILSEHAPVVCENPFTGPWPELNPNVRVQIVDTNGDAFATATAGLCVKNNLERIANRVFQLV